MPISLIEKLLYMIERSQSDRQHEPLGRKQWCSVDKRFTEKELLAIEGKWSIRIPDFYRHLLLSVGSGVFMSDSGNPKIGLELRRLDDILDMVAFLSTKDPHTIFSEYLPIGRHRDTGQAVLLRMNKEHRSEVVLLANLPESWDELDAKDVESKPLEDWLSWQIDQACQTPGNAGRFESPPSDV